MNENNVCRRLFTLLKLAEMGAHKRTAKISTGYLAGKLGVSQQTASRYLIGLDHAKWVDRTITAEGCLVRITDLGLKELQNLYSNLRYLMETAYPPLITLEGTVFAGLGEGAYYISKQQYRKQFIEKLGFDPYPGTLNLRLSTDYDVKARNELDAYPAITIGGFTDEDRTFGPVKCYPVIIQGKIKGALVTAFRSHYDASILEIIAAMPLRKVLRLKDGHKVKVEVLVLP